jgi:hypothetical protein
MYVGIHVSVVRVESERACILQVFWVSCTSPSDLCIPLGYENSGKTAFIECLLQRRLGFLAPGRATVCPVEYHLILNADMAPGTSHCWIASDMIKFDAARTSQPLGNVGESDLQLHVEAHMRKVMMTGPGDCGVTNHPLFIAIEASDLRFTGIVIEMPGIIAFPEADPDPTSRHRNAYLSANVIAMIKSFADHDASALIVCVDTFSILNRDRRSFRQLLVKPMSEGGAGIDPRQIVSVMYVLHFLH